MDQCGEYLKHYEESEHNVISDESAAEGSKKRINGGSTLMFISFI